MSVILSLLTILPILTLSILGVSRASINIIRISSLVISIINFALILLLTYQFDTSQELQFISQIDWINNYGISYYIGIDAISLVLLLLISFIMPLIFISIWNREEKGYFYNLLLLQSGVIGTLISLDLILFYLFWEIMLLPIFIMIGKYGYENREYNSMKIILMTVFGSMSMLFSILYLGFTYFESYGVWSFALDDLAKLNLSMSSNIILAGGFLLAFSIKIPLVGLHTWIAPAYSSAPTPALVILSAIMAKLGIYGVWRFGFGLFSSTFEYYQNFIIILAIIGIIFNAISAIMEDNLKRMFAFSSASHLSLIALGLFVANIYSWSGSLYLIISHAIASSGIFLMIGMIGNRLNTIKISNLGGIASIAPRFTFFFTLFALGIVGIPMTGGFVAEMLIIFGAFKYSFVVGVFSASTMISAIMFIFWMLQRTIFSTPTTQKFDDLSKREILIIMPLAILLIATGLFPSFFMDIFNTNLELMLQRY